MGAYSRWGFIRRWAVNRINKVCFGRKNSQRPLQNKLGLLFIFSQISMSV